MKKTLFSVLAVALTVNLMTRASSIDDGPIVINPIGLGDTISGPIIGGNPWHHAPAVPVLLPEAELLEGSLYFYPQVEYDVALRIEDATQAVIIEDEIHLYINNDNEYDVSTLPAGTYTLILGIAGREYEGEFRIEN